MPKKKKQPPEINKTLKHKINVQMIPESYSNAIGICKLIFDFAECDCEKG